MVSSIGVKVLLLAALVAVPFITSSYTAYQLGLYILFGIVGQGIVLCWGKGGFLPMGQALFFGIGAYISGTVLKSDPSWGVVLLAVLLSVSVPGIIAGIIGVLVFGRKIGSGLYFSLITLALSLLGYQLANSQVWLTGGFNGMTGIKGLPGIDSFGSLYFFIIGALVFSTCFLAYLIRTPFGQNLEAVRENEERLQFLGVNTSRIKSAAFAISGGVAGLAGAFFAPHQGIVTPQVVGFILSAELVIWTGVGGRFGLAGPVIGAVLIGFLASGLRDYFSFWEVIVALVFVIIVLRLPGGIAGLAAAYAKKLGMSLDTLLSSPRDEQILSSPSNSQPRLEFKNVSLQIGPVVILDDLSFEIVDRGIHCLIGPNGAGKTSALNVLTGKLAHNSGKITWCGQPLEGTQPFRMSGLGIGRKLQVPSIFPELTIRQNIDIALWVNRLKFGNVLSMRPYRWHKALQDRLERAFPFLTDAEVLAGKLSVGQRQMLDFSMTVLAEPDLILLDEPCAGLSKAETETMISAIADLAKSSKATFIIVEHDMQVVELLSDHVLVMHQGRLLAQGSLEQIRANPEVKRVYAGGSK